jgi:perosamine synthetase
MIRFTAPDIRSEDIEAVVGVLESGQISQGKVVSQLEKTMADRCQTKFAIAVCNGTTALHLALLAHGIKAGDEVITTAFSFIATTNAILMVGATPVYADIDLETYNLDPQSVAKCISPRTRAIMPVHLYGQAANMPALLDIAQQHRLAMIEDAAQAIGASLYGKPVGSFGTGCFSLYATKNITSGEGGIITTNDPEIARRCYLLRSHGSEQRDQYLMLGYNFRLSEIHAALGLQQLQRLETIHQQRTSNADFFGSHINHAEISLPLNNPDYVHAWHLYTLRVETGSARVKFRNQLLESGIETAIYYPTPAYRQPYLTHLVKTPLAMTEQAADTVFQIPVHQNLQNNELELIVKAINNL